MTGLGTKRRDRSLLRSIQELKNALRDDPVLATGNIAATYRELGDFRQAFGWWRRAAGPLDGNAWLEVGFCQQYGIGTRRNPTAAIRAYRQAIRTYYTTEFGQEEAQYHLAVALLDRDGVRRRSEATELLKRAEEDGDYPQATALLRQLRENTSLSICRCRRKLPRGLGGKAHCELHRGRKRA